MYIKYGADDYRRFLGFPDNYSVDGLLACGVWDLHAEEKHIPHLIAALDAKKIQYKLTRFDKKDIGHGYELAIADKIYWFVPVMGTAVMSMYIHMASLFGSKRNILLGSVGGLAPGMKSGDFIIPTSSIGNDNARMYDRSNKSNVYKPDDILFNILKSKLIGNYKVWEGVTTTCEILLAETQDDINNWSKEGILGVEMEAAIFFAASKYFKIPAVSLLFAADNLIEDQSFLSDEYKKSKEKRNLIRQQQYEIGLDLLINA